MAVGSTIIVAAQGPIERISHSMTATANTPTPIIIGSLLAGLSRLAGFLVALMADNTPETPATPPPPPTQSNK